jgi:hypothetical protein
MVKPHAISGIAYACPVRESGMEYKTFEELEEAWRDLTVTDYAFIMYADQRFQRGHDAIDKLREWSEYVGELRGKAHRK